MQAGCSSGSGADSVALPLELFGRGVANLGLRECNKMRSSLVANRQVCDIQSVMGSNDWPRIYSAGVCRTRIRSPRRRRVLRIALALELSISRSIAIGVYTSGSHPSFFHDPCVHCCMQVRSGPCHGASLQARSKLRVGGTCFTCCRDRICSGIPILRMCKFIWRRRGLCGCSVAWTRVRWPLEARLPPVGQYPEVGEVIPNLWIRARVVADVGEVTTGVG